MKYRLLLLMFVALTACNPRVITFLNPKATFENFQNYHLVNVKISKRKLPPEASQLLGVLEAHIKYQMETQRGYRPSNSNPDLVLRYELVSSARTDTETNPVAYNQFPMATGNRVVYESVILLELYHNKALVWQGSYDLTHSRKKDRNESTIKKVIDFIFTTYPYRAGNGQPDSSLTVKKKK